MRHRRLPQHLYEEVLALASAIAQPDAGEAGVDPVAAEVARVRLVALFEERQAAGAGDPFLTETVADFTDDVSESIRLYRLALQQCVEYTDEPMHTKRQGLAERLIEIGQMAEARAELRQASREAFAAGDAEGARELNELKIRAV